MIQQIKKEGILEYIESGFGEVVYNGLSLTAQQVESTLTDESYNVDVQSDSHTYIIIP